MTDYAYGYCGMPCALCTRYRTDGKAGAPAARMTDTIQTPARCITAAVKSSLRIVGAVTAFLCAAGKMGDFSDLNTNHAKERTCAAVASSGFDAWYADYAERADLLTVALSKYNDGRMKRFCVSCSFSGISQLCGGLWSRRKP